MKKIRPPHFILIMICLCTTEILFAQATRTWVSGLGDDVNPCSRVAPCKTFAGAISKTANGGEINAIDPAGYGAVTITKSMTIDGSGTMASILSSGTNGIIINAPGAVVTLRNLSINGTGTSPGLSAIRIMAARKVIIEKCFIANFSQKGIEVSSTDSCFVTLTNVTIHNTQDAVSVSSNTASVNIDDCLFQHIQNTAISLMSGQATVTNSNIAYAGVAVTSNSIINLSANIICNNGTAFLGAGKITSLGNNTVVGNRVQGNTPTIIKLQ